MSVTGWSSLKAKISQKGNFFMLAKLKERWTLCLNWDEFCRLEGDEWGGKPGIVKNWFFGLNFILKNLKF